MKSETEYQVYLNAFSRTKTGVNQHIYVNSGERNSERDEVANALGVIAAVVDPSTVALLTKTALIAAIDGLLK